MDKSVTLLRTSATTPVKKLASAITANYDKEPEKDIVIRAIGSAAINQSIKAVIISNKYFVNIGKVAYIFPIFKDVEGDKTAIEMNLKIEKI